MSLNGARGPGLAAIAIAVVTGVVYALHLRLPIRRTADAIAPSLALGSSSFPSAAWKQDATTEHQPICPGQ